MKKRLTQILITCCITCVLAGCETAVSAPAKTETVPEEAVTEEAEGTAVSDEEAAAHVAELIDAIYVQQRTDDTDRQCEEAKKAWDLLTDAQKELVEGEEASPDYFGLDTGDAAKDDPRNQDDIGENELLVVSFGTSYNDSRADDIKGIEDALQAAFPDWSVRRAFTAQIIINHVQARDNEKIDNMDQALERAVNNGVKNLVIQPTHLMHGAEYDELMDSVDNYSDKFETVLVAEPLLGPVGADASVINEDKARVADATVKHAVMDAGFDSLEAAKDDGTAFVLLGHGTSHTAKITYSQMITQMDEKGYDNVFIGTVEGEPEETECETVVNAVAEAGYKKVILRPFMVVAGDHANNDMAGDEEDSWKSIFVSSGKFDSIDTQIAGLGRLPEIQQLYVEHTEAVLGHKNSSLLDDGVYTVDFETDSSMFHVNEACEGKGTLSVKNNEMSVHISMPSKNVVNLFVGLAQDATKDGANLLKPTMDEVTYSDGTTEEVHGFDIPVPAMDEEYDVAILGTKGKWYDHKVIIKNPELKQESSTKGGMGNARTLPADGNYTVKVLLNGGTGKAAVKSPAQIVIKNKKMLARIEWSSSNFDYMKIGNEKFYPVNKGGNSVFEIPVDISKSVMPVIADTTAMGTPHEIEYSLIFYFDEIKSAKKDNSTQQPSTSGTSKGKEKSSSSSFEIIEIPGLKYLYRDENDYAEGFAIDYYESGEILISISDGNRFLIIPKDRNEPDNLQAGITVLKKPVDNIYLAATAVMDMFVRMHAIDRISLSGTKADGWYINEAKNAMKSGNIRYAGKYNMPDYEMILASDCNLAIESTMLTHSPKVKENLEKLGIPVLVDRSSYESHPLGRAEWIKLYAAIADNERGYTVFNEQKDVLNAVEKSIQGKSIKNNTVAFFFITSNGMVNVRKSDDFVPKMIELAGGQYIFTDLGDEGSSSSVNMTIEQFYASAKDADYLIYNSTIDKDMDSLNEMLKKSPVLKDFKAVKDKNVFCTYQNFYQESTQAGTFIADIYNIISNGNDEDLEFLYRLK